MMLLVQLAQSREIWTKPHGKVMTAWDEIAVLINTAEGKNGNPLAVGRSCREKFNDLILNQQNKMKSATSRSGQAESWEGIDKMLYECSESERLFRLACTAAKQRDVERAAAVTQRQDELKQETMITFSKRGRDSDSDLDSGEKKHREEKKKRQTTQDLIKQGHELEAERFKKQQEAFQNYTQTVDKRMGEGNNLLAALIDLQRKKQ
jgi:hypothetical protein